MSADNENFINFVKIIAGLPGTHCSYSRQRRPLSTMHIHRCAYNSCNQGWARGSFVEAEAEVVAERSRQRRGKAEAEAESSRPRRGRAKSMLFVSF